MVKLRFGQKYQQYLTSMHNPVKNTPNTPACQFKLQKMKVPLQQYNNQPLIQFKPAKETLFYDKEKELKKLEQEIINNDNEYIKFLNPDNSLV